MHSLACPADDMAMTSYNDKYICNEKNKDDAVFVSPPSWISEDVEEHNLLKEALPLHSEVLRLSHKSKSGDSWFAVMFNKIEPSWSLRIKHSRKHPH